MTRHRVATIAIWTSLVVALLLATMMMLPTLLGYQRYVIVSGSMVPTLPVGSVVYDEVVPVSELAVGDIITFVPPPEYGIDDPVTHRIVKISVAGAGQRRVGPAGVPHPGRRQRGPGPVADGARRQRPGAGGPPPAVRRLRLHGRSASAGCSCS